MASRRRSTVPPSMSTQKNMGVAQRLLRVAQQRVDLRCFFDIALEENDAAGDQRAQHRAQLGRDICSVEAHDEQLSNLLPKIESVSRRHGCVTSEIRSVPRTHGRFVLLGGC